MDSSAGNSTGDPVPPGPVGLDLTHDAHVYTAFGSGRVSIEEIVLAAERAGLSGVTFADPAGRDTPWLPAYCATIRRARRRTNLVLRTAIQVEAVRADGWVDFPCDLGELEAVSVVLSGLPTPSGLAGAVRLREMLRNGTIRPGALVEQVVSVTARALERTSRYAPSQLCRPLGLLQAAGVTDADVDDQALHGLVAACRVTGTVVEISEAWRTPSVRLVRMLAEAGVHLAAASDATEPAMVGAWRFTRTIAESLTPAAPVT